VPQRLPRRLETALAVRATIWIALYLLLATAPLLVLLARDMPPGFAFWWDLAMALGFSGMGMLGIQFALTARFKRATSPFGIDIVYFFHRYLAWIALGLVASHFAILWFLYPQALGVLDPREARWELTAGRVALACIVLAVATSQWRELLRLSYGWWRLAHIVFATVGFAAAVGHIVGVGYYTEAEGKRTLWLMTTVFWVALFAWVRVVRPWRHLRRPYRVVEVRPERAKTWTITLEPVDHAGLGRFMPGQFAWVTIGASPFSLKEHPFTIVSAPEELPRVSFSIKELGDFTARIGEIAPGATAYIDGPYGVFSIDRNADAPGFVAIVGGIGVTPLMSMARSMAARGDRRPFHVLYANKTWDDVVFREELAALSEQTGLRVLHVLQDPPEGWTGARGFVTKQAIADFVPEEKRAELHYFLCGPPPMTQAAEDALEELGVPSSRIQTEVFNLV
jgi:predicted ferric reductase